jgi:hypothetical protein
MRTTSLVKATLQIALPIHVYPASLAVDPRTRTAVVAVLARLLLEAASESDRSEEVRDES